MEQKLKFLSVPWFARLREVMHEEAARQGDEIEGATFSACEVVTECPFRPDTLAHWFRFDDGVLEMGDGEIVDPDFHLTGDYETMRSLARLPMRSSQLQDLFTEAASVGRLRSVGGADAAPKVIRRIMANVHDTICEETA